MSMYTDAHTDTSWHGELGGYGPSHCKLSRPPKETLLPKGASGAGPAVYLQIDLSPIYRSPAIGSVSGCTGRCGSSYQHPSRVSPSLPHTTWPNLLKKSPLPCCLALPPPTLFPVSVPYSQVSITIPDL